MMSLKTLTTELRKTFNHADFKSDVQKFATEAVYKREHDVFICMPSGAGKSLCFLLPAILQDKKVALVICPSLALIQDQINSLKRFKIRARTINSKVSPSQKRAIMKDLQSDFPQIKLLYLTPDVVISELFTLFASHLNSFDILSYIIVDEAHCISQFGHDYRPAYRQLEQCKTLYKNIPIVALTATAQQKVMEDILNTLQMTNADIFTLPAFRKNLFYDVWFLDTLSEPYIHLKNFITDNLNAMPSTIRHDNRNSGIIYCRTKQMTEHIAEKLSQLGIQTLVYHAGLNYTARTQVQTEWTEGLVPVIVATSAFGIGIDKGSVRFVVHWTVPQSIASYYQESGRAGRDEGPAFCRIYVSNFEIGAIRVSLLTRNNREVAELALRQRNCEKMFRYCLQAKCRHAVISKFFGNPVPNCNKQCDCCKNKREVERIIREFKRTVTKQPIYFPYGIIDTMAEFDKVMDSIEDLDDELGQDLNQSNTAAQVHDDSNSIIRETARVNEEVTKLNFSDVSSMSTISKIDAYSTTMKKRLKREPSCWEETNDETLDESLHGSETD